MTQIAEPVMVAVLQDPEAPGCPFSHDPPPDDDGENALIGTGTKLGNAMKAGRGTNLYSQDQTEPVLNPRWLPGPLYSPSPVRAAPDNEKANWPVLLKTVGGDVRLPVRCAAHHLIPAQEALKTCTKILAFMVKKGKTEPLKDAEFAAGKVWRDVGYDVNGIENGVYLPGSYAVGGGRGLSMWSTADEPNVEDEGTEESGDAGEFKLLTGSHEAITADTPKWQYIHQAMKAAGGQFHDRHEDYSRRVQSKLDCLAVLLQKQYDNYAKVSPMPCPDCEKHRKEWSADGKGLPPPKDLVQRFNGLSKRLRGYLTTQWALPLYTSKWVKKYMDARRSGADWARP